MALVYHDVGDFDVVGEFVLEQKLQRQGRVQCTL